MDAFALTTIPMLSREGDNYSTWSLCLLRILHAADPKLRGMVDGSYAEPVMREGVEAQVHFEEYRHWQAVSEGAKAILRTGLSDATRQMAGAAPNYANVTARQLWQTLEALYAHVTMGNKMAMHVAFDALRQGEASLDDFFAEVARRSNRLAALAWPVEPQRILNVLSYGLHPSFAHWIPALQSAAQQFTGESRADAAVLHRVLARIRQAESLLRQQGHIARPHSRSGLPAIPHAAAAAAAPPNGLALMCVYCKKAGHVKETCTKLDRAKTGARVKADKAAKASKKKTLKAINAKSAAAKQAAAKQPVAKQAEAQPPSGSSQGAS